MIAREKDPDDRRKQVVRIASAGEAIIRANLEKSLALTAAIRDRMGPDRHDHIPAILARDIRHPPIRLARRGIARAKFAGADCTNGRRGCRWRGCSTRCADDEGCQPVS